MQDRYASRLQILALSLGLDFGGDFSVKTESYFGFSLPSSHQSQGFVLSANKLSMGSVFFFMGRIWAFLLLEPVPPPLCTLLIHCPSPQNSTQRPAREASPRRPSGKAPPELSPPKSSSRATPAQPGGLGTERRCQNRPCLPRPATSAARYNASSSLSRPSSGGREGCWFPPGCPRPSCSWWPTSLPG